MRKLYWLDDEAWARIESHLPRGRKGARRVDDRRVLSAIVHMLQSGARWRDCPVEYGPYTTVYNRFNRWRRQGVWHGIFKALTGHSGINSSAAIDSTSRLTARRRALKGSLLPEHRPLQRGSNHQRSTAWWTILAVPACCCSAPAIPTTSPSPRFSSRPVAPSSASWLTEATTQTICGNGWLSVTPWPPSRRPHHANSPSPTTPSPTGSAIRSSVYGLPPQGLSPCRNSI